MFNNISPDNSLPRFGEDGDAIGEMDYADLTQVSRLDCPITLNPTTATFDDIAIHIMLRQRIGESTTKQYMIYLRMMETHVVPVNLRNPNYEEFIRHMDYREQIEQATPVSLMLEWQSMRKVLTAYGIPSGEGTLWNYKPPSNPPSKKRWIPLPETVHEMLQYRYCKDDYKNALIQYTLMHSFMVGWRNPSEMCMMKLGDVDIEQDMITVTEKKKHNKQRIIVLEKSIITGQTRKSFKNWIDIWRPKVANQKSGESLYLRKNGRPITEKQYRSLMYYWVLPIYPKYQPYISRHWCAIALLIKEKLETNHWNEFKVRNRLGHDRVQTTMTYIRDAEQYMQLAPRDWFKCVLKYHKVEESTLKTKIIPKNLCFDWKPFKSNITIGLYGNVAYGEVPLEILQDEGYFDFQSFTLSLFFNILLETEDNSTFSFSFSFFQTPSLIVGDMGLAFNIPHFRRFFHQSHIASLEVIG